MGLRNFMKHCGAKLQAQGATRKKGSVKDILEALSCLNGGTARSNARQMRSMAHTIQHGQTVIPQNCCPTGGGLRQNTTVVIFYDLTSMAAGELADAFIGTNKFFNDVKISHGFQGDVYHVGAFGERWVTWPAWVLNRNVHTRGVGEHSNAPHTGAADALDVLASWTNADGGATLTGSANGAVLYDGTTNLKTVYYGQNQTSPTMPPIFSATEELLVIGFCDEAVSTPNQIGANTGYKHGGYQDSKDGGWGLATDGSGIPLWNHSGSTHSYTVTTGPLVGLSSMLTNITNVGFKTDHTGSTGVYGAYDTSYWATYAGPVGPAGGSCQIATTVTDDEYTFKYTAGGALSGTLVGYQQTVGGPPVMFKHDYCISKKVIDAHLGNLRYFVYPVPNQASVSEVNVTYTLHLVGAMEPSTLAVAPTCAVADLTSITTSNPYATAGYGNMLGWGAGFGYNVACAPLTSTTFSTDLTTFLNL